MRFPSVAVLAATLAAAVSSIAASAVSPPAEPAATHDAFHSRRPTSGGDSSSSSSTLQSFRLRPTSALVFADGANEGSNEAETTTTMDSLLRSHIEEGAHGIYGTFRRLSLPEGASVHGTAEDASLAAKIRRHNELLDQFQSERHVSRFERYEKEMRRRNNRRSLQDDDANDADGKDGNATTENDGDAEAAAAAAQVVNVEEAAQQGITDPAVETLYEGVLPVISPEGSGKEEGEGDEKKDEEANDSNGDNNETPTEVPEVVTQTDPPVTSAPTVPLVANAPTAPPVTSVPTVAPVASSEAEGGSSSSSSSACSANPTCLEQGLTGECCPTLSGPFLACCPQSHEEEEAVVVAVAAQEEENAAAAAAEEEVLTAAPGTQTEVVDQVESSPVDATGSSQLPSPGDAPEVVPPAPGSDVTPPTFPPTPKEIEVEPETETNPHAQDAVIVDNTPDKTETMAAATAIAESRSVDPSVEKGSSPLIGAEGAETLTGGLLNSFQTSPLGQGYGTHYAHVWVGSPTPQRQSVIVDTGSHHTAFPCTECAKCGEEHHTDKVFDWSKSETFHPLTCQECEAGASCSGGKCTFSQSYTEGSSWRAYQVKDQFFCGGNEPDAWKNPIDQSFAIDFTFGCQTSETGLFITQLADGIMGMSASENTLTKRMHDAKKIEHKMFAMCFRRELEQSKEGVTAGILTIGGIDRRLQTSPMVYARNTVNAGWFTVYVRSIYVRSNGGQSAKADSSEQHTTKLEINLAQVNSGKGVIVDSGTTDTYFHRSVGGPFAKAFEAASGRKHSNRPIKLTREELLALPTILVQLDAYDDKLDPSMGSADSITGLVGELDDSRPADVLLAIPATKYMEYDPQKETYTSRLYFSEGSGSVLGANAMMGHDVLFDWENQRVGFAESNCEYIANVAGNVDGSGQAVDEVGVEADCVLGVPSMSEECIDNMDVSVCQGDGTSKVTGTEKWTMVVLEPGTPGGMSCEEVILRDYAEDEHEEHEHPEPPAAFCDGEGLCFKTRTCEMTCADVIKEDNDEADLKPALPEEADKDDDNTDDDFFASFQPCGDNLWGACEYTCEQEKIVSVLMTDGVCHEDKKLRKKRPCHIDACGRADPCRVPFIVHIVLGFRAANTQFWSRTAEDEFADAFAMAVDFKKEKGDELTQPGDVKVLIASQWFENDDPTRKVLGMKIVMEVSVFNDKAALPPGYAFDPITEEQAEAFEFNATAHTPNAADAVFNMIDKVQNVWKHWTRPLSSCEESDTLGLAKNALDIHVELERPQFMRELLNLLREVNSVSKYASPFAPIFRDMAFAEDSKVLTSWTVKTEIDGGTIHEHPISSLKGINGNNVMQYIASVPFLVLLLTLFFLVCCCGICCGSRCFRGRALENKQIAAILEELERRKAEKSRGKYAQVGVNGHVSDDEYSTGEIQFNGGYKDGSYDEPSHDGDLELADMENGMDGVGHDLDELEAMDSNGADKLNGLKSDL